MNLPKSMPKNLIPKIQHWDDERELGNSIIVSLTPGYEFGIDKFEKRHVDGFDNIKDAIAGLRNSVACGCAECVAKAGGKK